MIALPLGTKVFLACQPIDLRAGFDGLAAKVQQIIGADPFSGHVFIFRSKRGHYLKGLYWDGSGLCLFAKRLERNKFVWPPRSPRLPPKTGRCRSVRGTDQSVSRCRTICRVRRPCTSQSTTAPAPVQPAAAKWLGSAKTSPRSSTMSRAGSE